MKALVAILIGVFSVLLSRMINPFYPGIETSVTIAVLGTVIIYLLLEKRGKRTD